MSVIGTLDNAKKLKVYHDKYPYAYSEDKKIEFDLIEQERDRLRAESLGLKAESKILKRALELACGELDNYSLGENLGNTVDYFKQQAEREIGGSDE